MMPKLVSCDKTYKTSKSTSAKLQLDLATTRGALSAQKNIYFLVVLASKN